MFAMSVPWWEFVIRGIAVYAFLLIFLRLTGRRQYAQYDLFDMVLLLILANAVQNSMPEITRHRWFDIGDDSDSLPHPVGAVLPQPLGIAPVSRLAQTPDW